MMLLIQEVNAPMRLYYRVTMYGRTREIARTFHVPRAVLHSLNLPTRDFYVLTSQTVRHFVVVTAVSRDNYEQSLNLVISVQRHLPTHQFIVYNIGLTPNQEKQVINILMRITFNSRRNLLQRKFPISLLGDSIYGNIGTYTRPNFHSLTHSLTHSPSSNLQIKSSK